MERKPDKRERQNSSVFFLLAWILLFVMALLWSLDTFFIFIFLGAASYFLFLGFWHRPEIDVRKVGQTSVNRKQSHGSRQLAPLGMSDLVEKIRHTIKSTAPLSHTQKARVFVSRVMIFILAIFLIAIISILFSESQMPDEEAAVYYQRAEQFRVLEQYDSADRYYQTAISKSPAYPAALTGYGQSWLAREKYDSAVAQFQKALDIDPAYEDARYGKALTYYYLKNYKQSLKETLRMIDDSPEYLNAVLLSGDNYYMQQRYDSALIFYEDGYSRGERSAGLCHVMAYIYDTKGDQQKAIEFYKETLSYDSMRLEVYDRLGEFFPGVEGAFYRSRATQLKTEGN